TVRWTRAPGPLREAAGVSYQEFSSLKGPLRLKGDPFGVGTANEASVWTDMLLAETAKPLAFYDHPFFGRYPALTRNAFGKGTVTYQASVLTDALQRKVVADVLKQAGIAPEAELPATVRLRRATARDGKVLRFYLNFSGEPQSFTAAAAGTELLSQRAVAAGGRIALGPWDVAVVRE
ncbi:MAG TPA: beta-galactosidase trimerization domain-containing protein, partial [Vicinamibacteria bacterium]